MQFDDNLDEFDRWYMETVRGMYPNWLQFAIDRNIELPENRNEARAYMQTHYPEAFI